MSVGIRDVDGPRLAQSFHAAADWVAAGREEINRINVFPVPDGDTGTKFSLTRRSVADALRALGDAPLGTTAATAARGAVLGARGNSGMMLSHFLLDFAVMEGKGQATAQQIASGFSQVRPFGASVQVVVAGDILKVHVHTDTPEAVFTFAARWGTIEATKAVVPTTSQPTPGEFARVLREARSSADEAVAVLLASRLSGTYQSGIAAAQAAKIDRVEFVDCASASLGLGELALRGAEAAAHQPRDWFLSLATGVLGTHVGLGAWAVFYQVEDGTPLRPKERA